MDATRRQTSQAPEKLDHRFLTMLHRDGSHDVYRISGPAGHCAGMAAWIARACAARGITTWVYYGDEGEWPPIDMVDIAEDQAADWEPF